MPVGGIIGGIAEDASPGPEDASPGPEDAKLGAIIAALGSGEGGNIPAGGIIPPGTTTIGSAALAPGTAALGTAALGIIPGTAALGIIPAAADACDCPISGPDGSQGTAPLIACDEVLILSI